MHIADNTPDAQMDPPGTGKPVRVDLGDRRVRILVADDSELYRSGLVRAIAASADLELVAEVDGGCSAVDAVRALRPDVALLDYRMPDLDGWLAAQILRAEHPELRIALMSAHGDELFDRLSKDGLPHDPETLDAVIDKAISRREILDVVRSLVRATT